MNFQTKCCRWTTSLALFIILGLTSCGGKKNDEAANSPSPSNAPSESPVASSGGNQPATTASPGASSSSPAATALNLGVKPQGTNCPADAPIKGNISKRGKIYHETKFPDYKRVKPEVCFKDAATAEKAGYRKPQAK